MSLEAIREGWDQAARENAMYNILTGPRDWDEGEFFATGRAEVDRVMRRFESHLPEHRHRALDFGCGIGRLTRALTDRFESVDGVDISEEMIARAEGSATYHVNPERDLALFDPDTFDFIYSFIVLQHIPPELQRGYVEEFVRVLRPDGLAVFQIPSGPDKPHTSPWLSMYAVDPSDVLEWVSGAGGEITDMEVAEIGPWESCQYAVRK